MQDGHRLLRMRFAGVDPELEATPARAYHRWSIGRAAGGGRLNTSGPEVLIDGSTAVVAISYAQVNLGCRSFSADAAAAAAGR